MANDSGKVLDELHPIKVVSKVGYLVGMDLADAHRVASADNRYILTTTDYFTKYVEAVLIKAAILFHTFKKLQVLFCVRRSTSVKKLS